MDEQTGAKYRTAKGRIGRGAAEQQLAYGVKASDLEDDLREVNALVSVGRGAAEQQRAYGEKVSVSEDDLQEVNALVSVGRGVAEQQLA